MIKKILSIDLDCIWEGEETSVLNPDKKVNLKMLDLIKSFSRIPSKKLEFGIDHHEMCQIIDKSDNSFEIDNIDAHHDLYAENYQTWLNPLYIRGSSINIGNFLFQLLRERSVYRINWVLPVNHDLEVCRKKIFNNVGNYFGSKVHLTKALDYDFKSEYDFIFLSISPEWLPPKDLEIIENILVEFGLCKERRLDYVNRINYRWSLGDDEELISNDRFYFKDNYLIRNEIIL